MPQSLNESDFGKLDADLTANSAQAPTPFDTLSQLDDAAVSLLDKLTPTHAPDNSLLKGMPARDLNEAASALVKGLQDANFERINKGFNLWQRLTGQDIELRIRFDLATHEMGGLINDMIEAYVRAEASRDAIVRDAKHLEEVNSLLPVLIDAAARCASRLTGDPFHVERFKKRIAELETVAAANRLMEAQYVVAYQTLVALLDRTGEVTRVLLPLWQQHAFAIASAGVGDMTENLAMTAFGAIQKKIYARLSGGKEQAA